MIEATTLPAALRRAAPLRPDRVAWIFDVREGPGPQGSTTLTFSDYRFGLGLGEGDFEKGRLERLR